MFAKLALLAVFSGVLFLSQSLTLRGNREIISLGVYPQSGGHAPQLVRLTVHLGLTDEDDERAQWVCAAIDAKDGDFQEFCIDPRPNINIEFKDVRAGHYSASAWTYTSKGKEYWAYPVPFQIESAQ